MLSRYSDATTLITALASPAAAPLDAVSAPQPPRVMRSPPDPRSQSRQPLSHISNFSWGCRWSIQLCQRLRPSPQRDRGAGRARGFEEGLRVLRWPFRFRWP